MKQIEIGHEMAELCAEKAERTSEFSIDSACRFVLSFLREHGATRGELLVVRGREAGLRAHDERAWGAVFGRLSRQGDIRTVAFCERTRGHQCSGGRVWDLAGEVKQ